jgi:hypothetical protein
VESPLEILERNAERAGLREYIRQIEEVVRPMLGDQAPLQFLGSRM